jgi:hypothetical protein
MLRALQLVLFRLLGSSSRVARASSALVEGKAQRRGVRAEGKPLLLALVRLCEQLPGAHEVLRCVQVRDTQQVLAAAT